MNEWVRKAIQRLQGRMTQTRIREKRFFLLREPFCFVIQLEMDSDFDETLLVFDKTHLTGDTEAPYFLYGCAFLQKDDDPRHLAELGVTGLECTLRVARRVDSDDALDAFLQEAFAQFDAWEAEGKESVQEHSRQMRKAFMQDIAGLLKPLGFRKRSNNWVHPLAWAAAFEISCAKVRVFRQLLSALLHLPWQYKLRLRLLRCDARQRGFDRLATDRSGVRPADRRGTDRKLYRAAAEDALGGTAESKRSAAEKGGLWLPHL